MSGEAADIRMPKSTPNAQDVAIASVEPADPAQMKRAPRPASKKAKGGKAAVKSVAKSSSKAATKSVKKAGSGKPSRARAKASDKPSSKTVGKAVGKKPRLPARKTFMVAATLPGAGTKPDLRVYAAVQRTPAEALAAVQAELGADVAVELTGKLSNRMAKTLGIKAGELRQI